MRWPKGRETCPQVSSMTTLPQTSTCKGLGRRVLTSLYGHRYFRRMIAKFEEKMELFSNQIDELQSHLNVGGGASLTPQSNPTYMPN